MKFNLELNVYELATLLSLLARITGNSETSFRKFTEGMLDRLETNYNLDLDTLVDLYKEIEFESIEAPKYTPKNLSKIRTLLLEPYYSKYVERLKQAFEQTDDLETLQESLDQII